MEQIAQSVLMKTNGDKSMEEIKLLEIGTWEEKLGVQFEELSNQGLRTFHITPVVKIEIYNYNHFGN